MHAALATRQPAPMLARGALRLRRHVRPDAFGNALGESLGQSALSAYRGSQQQEALNASASGGGASGGWDMEPTDYSLASAAGRVRFGTGSVEAQPPSGELQAAFRASEREYRDLTEDSVAGGGYRARAGDSISRIVGSSDPQAVGNFMRANNLTSDRIEIGRNYFVPNETTAYGDSTSLGQFALSQSNERVAAAKAASLTAADGMRIGPTIERAQALGIYSGDASLAVAASGGSTGTEMRAWDGRSGVQSAANAHPFYNSFQYQAAMSVQDAVGVIALPELAAAKTASVVGGLILRGERLLGLGGGAAAVDSAAVRSFTFNAFDNPGPLAALPGRPAANFFGGRYNSTILQDDLVLYRAGEAGPGKGLGQWFAREAPESVAQVRIDSAVKPQWIDPKTGVLTGESVIDTVYAVRIPKGSTIYEGPVGSQGGVYLGGMDANQIFVHQPWNIQGVKVLGSTPLR